MEQVIIRPAYQIDEFCAAFGIGRTMAYAEIKAGRLKAFKIGKKTLVAGEDGIAWRDMYRGRAAPPKCAA